MPTATVGMASSALNDQALSVFVRKLRKAQSSAVGGEFMKDLSHTITSWHRVAKLVTSGLGRALKSQERVLAEYHRALDRTLSSRYRKRDTKALRKAFTKRLSDNWLEANFGLASSVRDLQDIGFGLWRAYDRSLQGVPHQHVQGVAFESTVDSHTFSASGNSPTWPAEASVIASTQWNIDVMVKYHGSVRIYVSNGSSQDRAPALARGVVGELGFNLSNFVPTVWECIPYSFVADYFSNIGTMLDALTFPRADVLWAEKGIRASVSGQTFYSNFVSRPLLGFKKVLVNQFHFTPAAITSTAWSRANYLGGLTPSFRLHLPYRKSDYVSSLAVLGQRLLKLPELPQYRNIYKPLSISPRFLKWH
jgi:hypothetical protein